MAAGACLAAVVAQGEIVQPLDHFSLAARLSNVAVSYAAYIFQSAVPLSLAAYYPFPDRYPAWEVAGAIVGLSGVTAAAVWRRRRPTGWSAGSGTSACSFR